MTTSTTTGTAPRELTLDDVRRELLDASERIELTEQGWVEKVTTTGHGILQTHLTLAWWRWAWTRRRSPGGYA